eukprot:scaffold547314_cov47-Prasinocladus_malaysianus.AAC.1
MIDNEMGSLEVDCAHLLAYDPDLYEQLVRYPVEATILLDNALLLTAQSINAPAAADLQLK